MVFFIWFYIFTGLSLPPQGSNNDPNMIAYQANLHRAFLQSAMAQNLQIQQQLLAQNQALQQLLQQQQQPPQQQPLSAVSGLINKIIVFLLVFVFEENLTTSAQEIPCYL